MSVLLNSYPPNVEWTPKSVSGLIHWSSADTFGLNDGNRITTWRDLSGNNNHATASAGEYYITYREGYRTFSESGFTSGKPYSGFWPEYYTGNICHMSFGNILSACTASTIFVSINVSTRQNFLPAPGQLYHLGLWEGTLFPNVDYRIHETFGSTTTHITTAPIPNIGFYWRTYIVTTKANEYKMYLDGSLIYSSGVNTVSFPSNFQVGQNVRGDIYTNPWPNYAQMYPYFNGGIRVFGLYNKALSTSEVSALNIYLRRYCII